MSSAAAGPPAHADPSPLSLRGRSVAIVLDRLEPGGAERQAMLLARHLAAQAGARVEVWGLGPPGSVAASCAEARIPCRSVPVPIAGGRARRWLALAAFASKLRRARFDALVSYTMAPNVLCGAVFPWTGAKVLVWNQRDEGLGRLGPKLERLALRHTRHYVANSPRGALFLSESLGVDPARVRVIRNGVEPPRAEADPRVWRRSAGLADEAFLVCMVSNLHRFKDHPTLLRAFRIALDRWPLPGRAGVLLLAGKIHDEVRGLLDLVETLRLGGSVRFLGEVSDVGGLLSAVDLGVFSSRSEGLPNGVLECMAAGLAVVASDIPGVREAVGREGAELLAPAGDAEALAVRLVAAAADSDLRARVGRANRRRAENEFSVGAMCEAMTRLLAEAIAAPEKALGGAASGGSCEPPQETR